MTGNTRYTIYNYVFVVRLGITLLTYHLLAGTASYRHAEGEANRVMSSFNDNRHNIIHNSSTSVALLQIHVHRCICCGNFKESLFVYEKCDMSCERIATVERGFRDQTWMRDYICVDSHKISFNLDGLRFKRINIKPDFSIVAGR